MERLATSVADLENRVIEHLAAQGYQVTRGARLPGKSGIDQTFDLVAQHDDAFATCAIALVVCSETLLKNQLRTVFDFANKAYDTGIRYRILISTAKLEPQAKELALRQRIGTVDAEQLESILTVKPKKPANAGDPTSFETKAHLLETLGEQGYRFERNAKVRGRSGTEYTFDVLAYGDHGLIAHSLGMDSIDLDDTIGLDRVLAFDSKAYDAGIDHKVLFIGGKLTTEAQQFALHQQIKILKLEPKAALETAKPETLKPAGKPETAGKTPGKQHLRQMVQPEAIQLIPEIMARRYNAIPLTIAGNTLQVAMANPTDIFALEAFAAQTRKHIKPVPATPEEVREAIDFNYKAYGEIESALSRISVSDEMVDDRLAIAAIDAPLTQALNLIIDEAAKARSSDIHIDPEENRVRVRYRIDGTLHDTMSLPLNIHKPLISRLKILAEMNIADHYRPQDGQFSFEAKGRKLDVRVATAPTIYGEMAVLRLLDKSVGGRGLSQLGMLPEALAKYEKMLKFPYGMIMISGPTGSGKSTTLYSSISVIDTMSKNIITIEDPAEYHIKDVNQIQVNKQAGITFASGLRSILRLDPNVIMVGEIRDAETAGIAIQAALTGHLMLSSIHANDSIGAIFRLLDLGIESFLIASSVVCVVAQRMVRRICPDCGRMIEAPVAEQIAYEQVLGEKRTQFRYGTGCNTCSFTGYLGRTGLFEILAVSDEIKNMLASGSSKSEIRKQALSEGMVPMIRDGMLKVKAGTTTPNEVLLATYTQE